MGLYGSGTILPELARSVLILDSWQQVCDGSCGMREPFPGTTEEKILLVL